MRRFLATMVVGLLAFGLIPGFALGETTAEAPVLSAESSDDAGPEGKDHDRGGDDDCDEKGPGKGKGDCDDDCDEKGPGKGKGDCDDDCDKKGPGKGKGDCDDDDDGEEATTTTTRPDPTTTTTVPPTTATTTPPTTVTTTTPPTTVTTVTTTTTVPEATAALDPPPPPPPAAPDRPSAEENQPIEPSPVTPTSVPAPQPEAPAVEVDKDRTPVRSSSPVAAVLAGGSLALTPQQGLMVAFATGAEAIRSQILFAVGLGVLGSLLLLRLSRRHTTYEPHPVRENQATSH